MAWNKKKLGLISTGITAAGGVVSAVTVPIVQKIDKDEDIMSALLIKINEAKERQEDNTKEMVKEVRDMFNAFAEDVRQAVRNIYQKIHDTELKIQENKHKIELLNLEDEDFTTPVEDIYADIGG